MKRIKILSIILLAYSVMMVGCEREQPEVRVIKEKCLPIEVDINIPKKIDFNIETSNGKVKISEGDFKKILKNYNKMKIELKKLSNYIKIHNKIQNKEEK